MKQNETKSATLSHFSPLPHPLSLTLPLTFSHSHFLSPTPTHTLPLTIPLTLSHSHFLSHYRPQSHTSMTSISYFFTLTPTLYHLLSALIASHLTE